MSERRINGSYQVSRKTNWSLLLPVGEPPKNGFPLLVLLHGQGESGARLEALLPELSTARFARLFIDAPWPVEIRHEDPPRIGGSWYAYVRDDDAFRTEISERITWLKNLVDEVMHQAPLDPRRVGLFGYSQGGYLASVAAVSTTAFYRGLCAVSTRIKVEMLESKRASVKNYPILVIHGREDKVIALQRQLESAETLKSWGADVSMQNHDGGHGIRRGTGIHIVEFFGRVFSACD